MHSGAKDKSRTNAVEGRYFQDAALTAAKPREEGRTNAVEGRYFPNN
jgi:hypothetical protein